MLTFSGTSELQLLQNMPKLGFLISVHAEGRDVVHLRTCIPEYWMNARALKGEGGAGQQVRGLQLTGYVRFAYGNDRMTDLRLVCSRLQVPSNAGDPRICWR